VVCVYNHNRQVSYFLQFHSALKKKNTPLIGIFIALSTDINMCAVIADLLQNAQRKENITVFLTHYFVKAKQYTWLFKLISVFFSNNRTN
jgi:hypothetical protein